MSNLITTQINQLAERFDLPQSEELYQVLKATAFKGDVTDAQLSALLIVSKQYGLNPWTKEIYAFPDKKNGIIPVVSVDGWARIINTNTMFDGMDFNFSDEMVVMEGAKSKAPAWTECVIHRKDRSHPTVIREYLDEVYKAPFKPRDASYTVDGPWQSHPKRMLRHKAMIQCARLAFGYGGIYDQDEAERIVEATTIDASTGEITPQKPAAPAYYSAEEFDQKFEGWAKPIREGKPAERVIAFAESRGGKKFTEEQRTKIMAVKAPQEAQSVQDVEPKEPKKNTEQSTEEFLAELEGN